VGEDVEGGERRLAAVLWGCRSSRAVVAELVRQASFVERLDLTGLLGLLEGAGRFRVGLGADEGESEGVGVDEGESDDDGEEDDENERDGEGEYDEGGEGEDDEDDEDEDETTRLSLACRSGLLFSRGGGGGGRNGLRRYFSFLFFGGSDGWGWCRGLLLS
jgi:hypothetical protein